MSTIVTGHWGNNYSPQAQLDVNVQSQNGGSVTYSYALKYVTHGYAAYTNGRARPYTISIDGQNISGSININGIGTTTVKTGTVTVSKSNGGRNIGYSVTFNMDVTWSGSYKGNVSTSGTIWVPTRESHTVSYNANGGDGAPSTQTKWWGSILKLSGTTPSRYGYTFQGWATSAGGGVAYSPNGEYKSDSNITLYAVWSANPYTITYNANGGSGAPASQTKYHNSNITLSSTRPSRTNYNFLGWGTSSGSTSVAYNPSSIYSSNSNITLYAIWQLAYKAPRIYNVSADRSNSGGSYQESGQYAKVSFKWETDRTVSEIKIEWKSSSSSSWSSVKVGASGTSNTVNQVIGNNGISTEYTYNVRITVRDSVGASTYNIDVPAMLYTMDFKAGGKGVAIGKPASENNLLDVAFNIKGSNGMPIGHHGFIWAGDLNQLYTAGIYWFDNNTPNQPNGWKKWGYIENIVAHNSSRHDNSGNWIWQRYYSTDGVRKERYKINSNTWTGWTDIIYSNTFNNYFDKRMNETFNGKFDSAYNNKVAVSYNKNIALGYGLQGKLVKRGNTVTISAWRQIVNWGGSGEFKLLAETIPSDIRPVEEVNLILTKNAGSVNPPPMTIHIQKDGHMYYTNFNPGTWVHCGTVTYQLV
ncbi:InlB B-repeat-containing protein [Enterococcus cecorum]|uniref:InlB B-repeat-containing protein n=1 Tax=Enterococcus cecorum TaxID=44008 RepID=UPI00148DFF89|nr:InlB B-repeat-containing protein [Enterococcus cecorum]